jgi:hypothetical protein
MDDDEQSEEFTEALVYIRRCVMVSLPLHGKINAVNGDNIVAFNNILL